jgi:hypothetical protein
VTFSDATVCISISWTRGFVTTPENITPGLELGDEPGWIPAGVV